MNELKDFQELKKRILAAYQNFYPQFQGDWKSFSSKDIRQLIDLIETELNERVSEKWIYTHLKPEINEKIPRKDMLDIFSRFSGFTDWDDFKFQNRSDSENLVTKDGKLPKSKQRLLALGLVLFAVLVTVVYMFYKKSEPKTIQIKNEFTNEPVQAGELQVFKVSKDEKVPVDVENSSIEVDNNSEKIIIESPYFETKEVQISKTNQEILIKPEDYAMVLKNFIHSDLKDWENRKEKLERILSEDLEVILMLKENLGAEYLNKKEFSGKLIVPTSETKKMKILNLETNDEKQITFIRIQQI